MLIVGLTGGIGSGKTTVANLFAGKGIPVIDADEITHQLSQISGKAYPALKSWLEPSTFKANGELDREKLREIAFSDPEILHRLEHLFHPLVIETIQEKLALLSQQQYDYVIVAVPLLIEARMENIVDRILVIDVPESIQLERVTSRDNNDPDTVKKILSRQIDRKIRLSYADDILENDGSLSSLRQKITRLDEKYRQLNQSH